jgi:hypothetical protein
LKENVQKSLLAHLKSTYDIRIGNDKNINSLDSEGIFVFKEYSTKSKRFRLDYFVYRDEGQKMPIMDTFESHKYLLFPRITSLEHLRELCSISEK